MVVSHDSGSFQHDWVDGGAWWLDFARVHASGCGYCKAGVSFGIRQAQRFEAAVGGGGFPCAATGRGRGRRSDPKRGHGMGFVLEALRQHQG